MQACARVCTYYIETVCTPETQSEAVHQPACHSAIVCSPDAGLNEKLPHACIAAMPQREPACIAGTLRHDPDAQVTSRVSQHHLTVAPLGLAINKLLVKHINIASSIMRFRDKGT